jgi:hypothetical protein
VSVVKRRRDAVEALEHAMQGVQTTWLRRIERRSRTRGLVRIRSAVRLEPLDDTPVEHEVTVVMRPLPRRHSR